MDEYEQAASAAEGASSYQLLSSHCVVHGVPDICTCAALSAYAAADVITQHPEIANLLAMALHSF